MEVVQAAASSKKPMPKLNFKPCNKWLLCRKVEISEFVGKIVIPNTEKWQSRFEVVAASPDLLSYLEHFDVGDIILYPVGAQEMYINIDGSDYYFLDKQIVVSRI